MYRTILLAMLALFPLSTVHAQDTKAIENEFVELENALSAAWQKGDAAFLKRLLAEDYMATDSDGSTSTKSEHVAFATSGDYKVQSFQLDDFRVRVYGDTAVVTCRETLKATEKGKDVSGPRRYTDVFVKRDGRWQLVTEHESLVSME